MTPISRDSAPRAATKSSRTSFSPDPHWYKDAVIYELHVRAFADSDGDGIGDFRGLTQKLDYLQDLGVTALWLLPFYPSPLRDDGYDIADYRGVHPNYGTLQDFQDFLDEAHARGLRVITELVLNHTSDQHPWFERARRAPKGSTERDFYVWSDTPERYREARIIFKDFEGSNWAWDDAAEAYYWHRFYSHQPDLNFENPAVREAIFEVVDFWLERGVDGLRLDAVPYLFEREGTHSENLPSTHAFLKELRSHIDAKFVERMLLAEANQWPEDAYDYFGDGDECHMAFHFPLMPRMFVSLQREDRLPMVDIMEQTPQIPESAQWALFLRNHDELTLEMVTEEERAYMYRVYAEENEARINVGIRRRLAPLLNNNRRRAELLHGLLFSLPGTPVLYYGDEIGMGDNVYLGDRNGVRTPMQWSADRNAGFSQANPQRLYLPLITDYEYHHASVNVETQARNPSSLLNWTKRLINVRSRYRAFGRGSLTFLHPRNRRVLAFLREFEGERLLVVANLSRFSQSVALTLSDYAGCTPVEVFGQMAFPEVGEEAYGLTLAPHTFYWFSLENAPEGTSVPEEPPTLRFGEAWEELLASSGRAALERALPHFLQRHRWFGGKARTLLGTRLEETVPVGNGVIAFVRVNYNHGDPETYMLPLIHTTEDAPPEGAVVVRTISASGEGTLVDAVYNEGFVEALYGLITEGKEAKGRVGTVQGATTGAFEPSELTDTPARLVPGEQSNTSVFYRGSVLKLFRRVEGGTHPELELEEFLAERDNSLTPPMTGTLLYRPAGGQRVALGVLHSALPHKTDAWERSLVLLEDFLARVSAGSAGDTSVPPAIPFEGVGREPPQSLRAVLAPSLKMTRDLGACTARFHRVLTEADGNPNFIPEPFTPFAQRSLYGSLRSLAVHALHELKTAAHLPEALAPLAAEVLEQRGAIFKRLGGVRGRPLEAKRVRIHGNYHLGQLLLTDEGWQIIDLEGEPSRPLSERRIKSCALVDVASMLRSLSYAGKAALKEKESGEALGSHVKLWTFWAGASFLAAYLEGVRGANFLPEDEEELATLLEVFVLQRALYELDYELNNRPDWVGVPLEGILEAL